MNSKPRARDLGLPFPGRTGPNNAITDVPGVLVGYRTLISERVRTGVTAVLPHGRASPRFCARASPGLGRLSCAQRQRWDDRHALDRGCRILLRSDLLDVSELLIMRRW